MLTKSRQLSDPLLISTTVTARRTARTLSEGTDFSHYNAPRSLHMQPLDVGDQVKGGNAFRRWSNSSVALSAESIASTRKPKKAPPVAPRPKNYVNEEYGDLLGVAPPSPCNSNVNYECVAIGKTVQNGFHPQNNSEPLKQLKNELTQASPPWTALSSKAPHLDKMYSEIKMNKMAEQIKGVQDSLAKIVKQMDEVLAKQYQFEAQLNALGETGLTSNEKVPLINRGMSPTEVSEVVSSYIDMYIILT